MFWCGSPAALTNQFNQYSTGPFFLALTALLCALPFIVILLYAYRFRGYN
jgi:hypothetical protein